MAGEDRTGIPRKPLDNSLQRQPVDVRLLRTIICERPAYGCIGGSDHTFSSRIASVLGGAPPVEILSSPDVADVMVMVHSISSEPSFSITCSTPSANEVRTMGEVPSLPTALVILPLSSISMEPLVMVPAS